MHRATLAGAPWILTALAASAGAQMPLDEGPRQMAELVLSSDPQPLRIPATLVDTVWTPGSAVTTGALVSALLGMGLGVGLAVAECGGTSDCGQKEAALLLGAIGLGGGALVGSIGFAVPEWHQRYP